MTLRLGTGGRVTSVGRAISAAGPVRRPIPEPPPSFRRPADRLAGAGVPDTGGIIPRAGDDAFTPGVEGAANTAPSCCNGLPIGLQLRTSHKRAVLIAREGLSPSRN
jgi:hypothetical protein